MLTGRVKAIVFVGTDGKIGFYGTSAHGVVEEQFCTARKLWPALQTELVELEVTHGEAKVVQVVPVPSAAEVISQDWRLDNHGEAHPSARVQDVSQRPESSTEGRGDAGQTECVRLEIYP